MENSSKLKDRKENVLLNNLPYLGWITALLAMVGSLFFSEVMQIPACSLCWYQRIAMYPLVLIIGVGIILNDKNMKYYALPLCLCGLAIAFYHNLLYYGVIPESLTPCSEGVSCKSQQIEWLGFITIPFLSMLSFIVTGISVIFFKPREV